MTALMLLPSSVTTNDVLHIVNAPEAEVTAQAVKLT